MFASDRLLPLLVLLSTIGLTVQATAPSCTHVADFDDCQGNALDFCPKGIACGCKNQRPFCRCPSYRNHWQNYWYMGPKCDQLWSTLDMILATAIPAITLSVAVAVMMQWASYCKSRPGKGGKRSRTLAREPSPQTQSNLEHASNLADKASHLSQTQGRVEFPRLPLQSQHSEQRQPQHIEGFSYIPQQPPRRAAPMNDNASVGPSRSPVGQLGFWKREIPDVDYVEINPFVSMPMQQFSQSGASAFPQTDYHEKRPFRIGYPQNMYA